jgi:hypothetical protein
MSFAADTFAPRIIDDGRVIAGKAIGGILASRADLAVFAEIRAEFALLMSHTSWERGVRK